MNEREKVHERKEGCERRRQAATFEPFEQRHERDRDDERGGERQEEFGAGLPGERQSQAEGRTEDTRERGEQPAAADIVNSDLVPRIYRRRSRIIPAPALTPPCPPR